MTSKMEFVVEEFLKLLKLIFIYLLLNLILQKIPLQEMLLIFVLLLMPKLKFGIFVTKIQLLQKNSNKILELGLSLIISNLMIYPNLTLFPILFPQPLQIIILMSKITGLQLVLKDCSNLPLISVLKKLKKEMFMNPSNQIMVSMEMLNQYGMD